MNKTRSTVNFDMNSVQTTVPAKQLGQDASRSVSVHEQSLEEQLQVWKPFRMEEYLHDKGDSWPDLVTDLLSSMERLSVLLQHAIRNHSWLNAYLLAAGMNQIAEDYLHPDPFQLGKAATYFEGSMPIAGPMMAMCMRAMSSIYLRVNRLKRSSKWITLWQQQLDRYVSRLAEVVITGAPARAKEADQLKQEGEMIAIATQFLPQSLKSEIIRLPSCFNSFDQRLEDLQKIVDEFTLQWPERKRMIKVIGIRTSGSYLAPLYASLLKLCGYERVSTLTIRPGRSLSTADKRALHELKENDGLALVCDDPPISGSTLSAAASQLQSAGLHIQNIILILQLFGDFDSLPYALQKYPSILLSWSNWSIHELLEVEKIKKFLSEQCLPGFEVAEVVRLPNPENKSSREHMRAMYRVRILSTEEPRSIDCTIRAKGIGMGYFGEHVLAVNQKLQNYSAQVIGISDGLLFQELPMPEHQLSVNMLSSDERWLEQLIDYEIQRNQVLPAPEDTSLKLFGRNATWEVSSNIMANAFRKGWPVARKLFLDRMIRRIMQSPRPTIIDGNMNMNLWSYRHQKTDQLIKMDLADRDFSHLDLFSYDPAFDLAGLAQEIEPGEPFSATRHLYETTTGFVISPERWMLNQLVHIWDMKRMGHLKDGPADRAMEKVLQQYFAEIYFQNFENKTTGPLIALDIDGVLETKVLGFTSLTPASARSLQALLRHGYRIVYDTGRSLDEVKERSEIYHFGGGVAEYGSVIFDQHSGQSVSLLTAQEQKLLGKLRKAMQATSTVIIDPEYRFSVRAYYLTENGIRTRLPDDIVSDVLSKAGVSESIIPIHGNDQTDFVIKRVNKNLGLQEWIKRFDLQYSTAQPMMGVNYPILMAAGDSEWDLPMFRLAKLAFMPAQESRSFHHPGVYVTRQPYQKGFEEAVSMVLGHAPGSCPDCHINEFSSDTNFVQKILSVQESGRIKMLWQTIKLCLGSSR